jgi:hypothetical protein
MGVLAQPCSALSRSDDARTDDLLTRYDLRLVMPTGQPAPACDASPDGFVARFRHRRGNVSMRDLNHDALLISRASANDIERRDSGSIDTHQPHLARARFSRPAGRRWGML